MSWVIKAEFREMSGRAIFDRLGEIATEMGDMLDNMQTPEDRAALTQLVERIEYLRSDVADNMGDAGPSEEATTQKAEEASEGAYQEFARDREGVDK